MVATRRGYATSCTLLFVKGQQAVFPPREPFASFPRQVGDWSGREQHLESIILESLELDDYLMADYRHPSGDKVNLYVPYYASQQAGSAAHSPRACIPGGGWQVEDAEWMAGEFLPDDDGEDEAAGSEGGAD